MKTYIEYIPQNTGWSGGVSWFRTSPSVVSDSMAEAFDINKRSQKLLKDSNIKYRVVKRITTEEYLYELP